MDRRLRFRRNLSVLYLPYYTALCDELSERWQPYSGFRGIDEQTVLYNKGRGGDKSPVVTRAKGGQSAHNYGCASDWTIWKDGFPVWMNKTDSDWHEYLNAIEKVGLKAGADFGDFDHNELHITTSWTAIYEVFLNRGMVAAQNTIKNVITR